MKTSELNCGSNDALGDQARSFTPYFVDAFPASGVVLEPRDSDSPAVHLYVVLHDNSVFLFKSESAARETGKFFDPVPPEAQEVIRSAHPTRHLLFPPEAALANARYQTYWCAPDRLYWVDPKKINILPRLRLEERKKLLEMHGETLGTDWDLARPETFETVDVYQAFRDRMVLGKEWQETAFCRRVETEINKGVRKWGCGTIEAFRDRCKKLEDLYHEIRSNGYKTQQHLRHKIRDEIRVGIDRNGRLVFLDGKHRLSIARLLDLPKIPVRIVLRHQKWEDFKEQIRDYARNHGGRIYQTIDHPDLIDLPAQHGEDRIALLKHALAGYDCAGKRLLDVGAHWGYMSQQMEQLGFQCTAIERNRHNAAIAEGIRVATESRFQIWTGDTFDFPEPEKQDVVLALNIFHHLTKTDKLHAKLVRFLNSLRADMILFEPHNADPPGQMAGAYRNYPPQEFAEFVAHHAQLAKVTLLGRAASGGRPLFKITR